MKALKPRLSVGLFQLLGMSTLLACGGEVSSPSGPGYFPVGAADAGGIYVDGSFVPIGPGVGVGPGSVGNPADPSGGQAASGTGINLAGAPKYFRFVRLTNEQWTSSVQQVLNLSAPTNLAENFQGAVSGTTDFSNNEYLLDVNQRVWSDYQDAAEKLADQVTSSSSALAAVYAGTDADGFIRKVGRRAYRRPLTQAEISTYTGLFSKGSAMSGTKSSFAKGAQLVLRAMLQSPHFVYRVESGPAGSPLSGYEIAAKLSLWLRGSTPDDALLDMADRLTTADAVGAQAAAMLEDSRAQQVMREFVRELLHFDRYTQISKIGVPSYSEALNAELEETSYRFFDKIFAQGLGVKEFLTSTSGFVGPRMAQLYGLGQAPTGYVERDLGPARAGYFSQLPYLVLHGLNDMPDSIHRGVSLNLDVLCAPLGPPATVIPPIPPLKPGQTNRQRIDTLTMGCGGSCHNEMINPLGFAFEHFDGMGQYRDQENGGLPIDSSGSYAFTDGRRTYKDNAELMSLLASEEQTHLCFAKKLAGFALQRDVVAADLPWLKQLAAISMSNGGSVKRIIVELSKSDAFRTRLGGTP